MQVLTIDFETYYDRAFSLSKMTTEEYIRDELFETIGVAVQVNDGEPVWFSGTKVQTKRWLDQFDWANSIAVAHNSVFDMAILNWHFDIRPKRIADTLSMARALHGNEVGVSLKAMAEFYELGVKGDEVINALGKGRIDFTEEELARYGEYCRNDVKLTYDLFNAMLPRFPMLELKLVDLTIRMFTEPALNLNKALLEDHLVKVKDKKAKLMSLVEADKEALMSNPKLATLLQSLGVVPPTKVSARTGKTTWAFGKTDEEFKALLDHEDPRVQAVVAARLGVKSTLEETRTERFIRLADRGTLPIPLRYYAAHTGRWGGDDKVNMQNLPRKSPLKKAILAPDGHVFIDCDSSQIEARTLAWLAGQNDLVEFFEKNNDEIAAGVEKKDMQFDPYKIMASQIYGVPVNEVTDDQRFVGKTTILGCLAEGTLVLTDRGWVAIEEVTTFDQLWDGEEWVCHQGLVKKGIKETLNLCGVWLTPDHKILCGTQWLEAQSVAQDRNILSLALGTGAVSWLSPDTLQGQEAGCLRSSFGAIADDQNIPWTNKTLRTSKVPVALHAVDEKGIGSATGVTPLHSLTMHTGNDYLTASLPPLAVATYLPTGRTQTMEGVVSPYTSSGATTGQSFYDTSKPYRDGITPSSTWTVPITAEGMNPETFGLSQEQKTMLTAERSVSYRRNLMTYDIAYAGPRNRYTIATNAGAIIVHNCGYGMGALKFKAQLKAMGVDLPMEECERIIHIYRTTYPMIPALWKQGQEAIKAMIGQATAPLGRQGVVAVNMMGIRLPNGLYLRYPNLREQVDQTTGKREVVYDQRRGRAVLPTRIYGGKLIENVCQALARIVIGEQMLEVAKKLRVVMTVHDAVGSLAPEAQAEQARQYVEQCMRIQPKWANGLPLNCESKMGASYGG